MSCSLPPPGWSCSRDEGHEGPCAATPLAGEVAQPWYQSKTLLGILAAILLTIAQKLGLLGDLTQDQLVEALMVIIPLLVALWGRLNVSRPVVTATAAKAKAINNS